MPLALPLVFWFVFFTADAFYVVKNDLVFDSDPLTPRAELLDKNGNRFAKFPRTDFTFCFFLYLDNRNGQTAAIVSYASKDKGTFNEVLFEVNYFKEPFYSLTINDARADFPTVPAIRQWTHVCVSWSTYTGNIHMFINGTEVEGNTKVLKKRYRIGGGGCFVLGQDQDSFDGGYDAEQGLKGRITQFNLWKSELTASEVKQVSKCDLTGNLIDWSTSQWKLKDGLKMEPTTAPCPSKHGGEVRTVGSATVPAKTLDKKDFVFASDPLNPRAELLDKNGKRFSQLPPAGFTFCFFAYFENTAGQTVVPISYASQAKRQANEVLFEINYFKEPYSIFMINNVKAEFPKVPPVKQWTHICASWRSASGNIHVFMNGTEVVGKIKALKPKYWIGGDGCFILGQDQDSLDGGYDAEQGVKGRITQFNLWDKELSSSEVNDVMKCALSGNVVGWSKSQWKLKEELKMEPTTASCAAKR